MVYYNVPGVSIAVINDGGIEWAKGYGVLESGNDDLVTTETIFQTGSIAKPVVSAAALSFVERGDLALDDEVNSMLLSWQVPENEYTAESPVTLRGLLSHSAGISVGGFRGYASGEAVPTLQQILEGELPANSPPIRVDLIPGTQYRYSGGGYMVVEQLLVDLSGDPLDEIVQESILEPLEMESSTFITPLPREIVSMAASGHRSIGDVIPGRWLAYLS